MKNSRTILFWALLLPALLMIMFSSCEKEEISTSQEEVLRELIASIKAENGVLTFASNEDFTSLYKLLSQDEEHGSSILTKFDYYSADEVLDDIEDLVNTPSTVEKDVIDFINRYPVLTIEKDSSLTTVLDDPILAHLFNENGALVVGQDLLIFLAEEVLYIKITEISSLSSFLASFPNMTMSDLLKMGFDYQRYEAINSEEKSECSKRCYDYRNSKRRLKGKIWKLNLWFIKAAGAYSKSQRKRWGIWFRKRTDRLQVRVAPSGYDFRSRTRYNKRRVSILEAFSFWGGTGDGQVPDLANYPLDGRHSMDNDLKCETCR